MIDVVNAGCGTDDIDLLNGNYSFDQLQQKEDLTDDHINMLAEIDLINQSSHGVALSQFRATNNSGNELSYGDVSPIRPRKLPN